MHRLVAIIGIGGLLLTPLACRGGSTTNPDANVEPSAGAPDPDPERTDASASTTRPERAPITPTPEAQAIVDAADRPASDRKIDARRRPAELLTFLAIEPGMKVADLMAGGGYTTELLSRSVGAKGVVFAQNNAFARDNIVKGGLAARLERDVVANVVKVDAEFDAPLPPEATELDLVTIVFSYHDAVVLKEDMATLNRAVFAALAPGGRFVVLDHAAAPGTPLTETEVLHRLDEALVVQQVMEAGFERGRSSDFLRNPSDDRAAPAFRIGFETDRFALEFIKPR